MAKCKSFLYRINNKSTTLILGSMPGIKSLELQQYYAHPQNRFWRIMAHFCHYNNLHEADYETKINVLLQNNFALWDVLGFCEREGSLDSNIQKEIPNNISELLKNYPNIQKICLNGDKSYKTFKKHFPDLLNSYNCYKLPSSSPANARFKLEDLINEWGKVL